MSAPKPSEPADPHLDEAVELARRLSRDFPPYCPECDGCGHEDDPYTVCHHCLGTEVDPQAAEAIRAALAAAEQRSAERERERAADTADAHAEEWALEEAEQDSDMRKQLASAMATACRGVARAIRALR